MPLSPASAGLSSFGRLVGGLVVTGPWRCGIFTDSRRRARSWRPPQLAASVFLQGAFQHIVSVLRVRFPQRRLAGGVLAGFNPLWPVLNVTGRIRIAGRFVAGYVCRIAYKRGQSRDACQGGAISTSRRRMPSGDAHGFDRGSASCSD
jgi:hypothetical protein